jgi:phage/plasmid-associated DNA primase
VLYSEVQGVGKNTIIILLQKIFAGYVGKIERIEEITAKFNTHLASKLFIYADEVQAKAREVREDLKNMITRDLMKVEGKGTNAYYMQDYSNYIFTTNNRDAFFIEATDRRFYMFNLADKVMTEEKSRELYKLLDDVETIESFDSFLKNRELPDELPKMMNKYKESLISNSLPAYIKMVYDNIDSYESRECTTNILFKRAQQYAKENALQWTFSKEKFQKDFKKEFKEFHKKTMIQNVYKFPPKKELIAILMSKRRELMSDYILDEEAELISDEEDNDEGANLNL